MLSAKQGHYWYHFYKSTDEYVFIFILSESPSLRPQPRPDKSLNIDVSYNKFMYI